MAGKPISSVLEKIRKRKMELSKKAMFHGRIQSNDSVMETAQEGGPKEDIFVSAAHESRTHPISQTSSALDVDPNGSPLTAVREDENHLTQTSTQMHLAEENTPSFRAPLNDTQDLFSDSQMSDIQSDQSNEKSGRLEEECAASSLPSLNLKFDSALPDDICSEESDEDNTENHPQTLFEQKSSPKGDPVKAFLDEEALEDDSDNDLLQFEDEDEYDDDMEEVRDYIATDYKEKPIDREKRNELHQMWLQQQDESGTDNLLQRLKHGTNQREPSVLRDEDDDNDDTQDDESDDDDTEDLYPIPGARLSTRKLRQMIPQMFTDKDDGFVSSDDEETERQLSKQRLLQKLELEKQPKLLSPTRDETSSDVFGRIKKLNTVPESKKKTKTSYLFDSLLTKGSSNSAKSSFLRQSSSHPMTSSHPKTSSRPKASSHRTGPAKGRSFIFERDDSNSRSSILAEDRSNLSQKQTQTKKNASAKFISSQAKRSASQTETRSGVSDSTSLFEVLRRSSMQKGDDTQVDMVDQQAVFAAFKSVTAKRVKIEGRP